MSVPNRPSQLRRTRSAPDPTKCVGPRLYRTFHSQHVGPYGAWYQAARSLRRTGPRQQGAPPIPGLVARYAASVLDMA
eukprot:3933539-Rhodomonas_salina.2